MNRTHNNGELRLEHVGQVVELKGWVAKTRNLGGLVFIDLRDRYGITQLVANPENVSHEVLEAANKVRNEYVIAVKGTVAERQSKNPNMATGDIEIILDELTIISEAEMTPLIIADETDALEDTRLKYRYLDLRRPVMQKNFILRHNILKSIRSYLDGNDFIEVETPYLNKSTPEGARDYLVPSRVHEGHFYALPQSPQIFKQLLMVSGFERYYQIARCFRDEDLRADRQPEFTQIDIETSFLTQEEIMNMIEEMLVKMMKDVKGLDVARPFPRLSYEEAMGRYGSDKPDTRFEMELIPLNHVVANCGFSVFVSTVEAGNEVKALCVKGAAERFSRKDIDKLTDFVKKYKGKVVILDMLKDIDLGINYDINSYQDIGQKLLPKLRNLCEKYNITILFTHHLNKQGKTLGSTAFDAVVDGKLTLIEDKNDKSLIRLNIINRDFPSTDIYLKKSKNQIFNVIEQFDEDKIDINLVNFIKYAVNQGDCEFTCAEIINKANLLMTPKQCGRMINSNMEYLRREGLYIKKIRKSDKRLYQSHYEEPIEENE